MRSLLSLFFSLILLHGCATKTPSPEAALQSYLSAVKAKDAKKTYALLSRDLQKSFGSEAEFTLFFGKYYTEILQEAERLLVNPNLRIEATLPLQNDAQAFLYQSPQGWIVYQESTLSPAKSVAEALQGLRQLALRKTEDGPLDFYLSAEAREERRLRLQAFAAMLALVGPYDLSVDDAHAVVRLKDGRTLRFFLESEHWSLVSLPEELLF
jgi:hypothetical protein